MLEFFNQNFGRYFVAQTGDKSADAQAALSSGHAMKKGGAPQRISSGWAIVRPGGSAMQMKFAATGIEYRVEDRYTAFLAELEAWDGTPRIFLTFDKKPVPIGNVFVTYDLRAVRICSPASVETFDFTVPPDITSGVAHKVIWKKKGKKP